MDEQETNNIDVLQKLIWEYKDLALQFFKLKSALKNEALLSTINKNQVELMQRQFKAMEVYLSVLQERIKLFLY